MTGQSRWPLADANARRREPDLVENAKKGAVQLPPIGRGSVSGAPQLSEGFTDIFTSSSLTRRNGQVTDDGTML